MMIRVIYRSGETGLVKACDLDALIRDEQVLAFCRSEGWAIIGIDPIRETQRPFAGSGSRWSDILFSPEAVKNGGCLK